MTGEHIVWIERRGNIYKSAQVNNTRRNGLAGERQGSGFQTVSTTSLISSRAATFLGGIGGFAWIAPGRSRRFGCGHTALYYNSDFVGQAPWPAADPLVGLLGRRKSRTRGSGADGGVRPTFWLRLCCRVEQSCLLLAGFN
jgi:hypothetical protein